MHIDEYREFHCFVSSIFGISIQCPKHNQRTKLAFYCILRDPVSCFFFQIEPIIRKLTMRRRDKMSNAKVKDTLVRIHVIHSKLHCLIHSNNLRSLSHFYLKLDESRYFLVTSLVSSRLQ